MGIDLKILVTGANGQLGRELLDVFGRVAPSIATGVTHDDLDITDSDAVERFLANGEYTHVVNCAAYTAVDRAEEEKHLCNNVNNDGVANIARNADTLNLRIIHISTDYVFDGKACRPYSESAKPEPLSVYGTTKRKGETALLGLAPSSIIIRTGWLYSPHGRNFVKTMLAKGEKGEHLAVVDDQTGTPTYAADLAEAIATIILSGKWMPGIYNYSNEGTASWYDFAVATLEAAGLHEAAADVTPVHTADYPTAATRPAYAVLDKTKIKDTFGLKIPHWQDGLRRCIARLRQ